MQENKLGQWRKRSQGGCAMQIICIKVLWDHGKKASAVNPIQSEHRDFWGSPKLDSMKFTKF